jgi:hypothetical protein
MNTTHAPAICALALVLGGCLGPSEVTRASIATPVAAPVVVGSADDVPAVTEPGQRLRTATRGGGGAGGVDPYAELRASEQARVAWAPLRPGDLTKPSTLAARTAGMAASGRLGDPASTASLAPSAKVETGTNGMAQGYDGEATLNRLESDARRINKPICKGC